MNTTIRRHPVGFAVAISALLAAAGGIVFAAIPDSAGVIHGCYNKFGSLRVIDVDAGEQCNQSETALQWNQAGPAGTSEAFATSSGLNPLPLVGEVTVASLSLPAGNYVLEAKVLVGNSSGSSDEALNCTLRFGASGSGLIDVAETRLFGGAPATSGSYATLPLAGSISLASSDTIRVICLTTGSAGFAQYAKLNAVRVGTLNTQ